MTAGRWWRVLDEVDELVDRVPEVGPFGSVARLGGGELAVTSGGPEVVAEPCERPRDLRLVDESGVRATTSGHHLTVANTRSIRRAGSGVEELADSLV